MNEHKKSNSVKRNYKDSLFRKIFSNKEDLLSLYNVMSGSDYMDPELLTIITLENAIYMNMKNDLAFLIDSRLFMYEHQSTHSPNMPLRDLFYIAKEYESLVTALEPSSIYSSKLIELSPPSFVVFYNGPDRSWKTRTLKLSDSYNPKPNSLYLELIVKEININLGVNDELFKHCKPLYDYMQFVEKVKLYSQSMSLYAAVDQAVNECIEDDILKDFLLKNKSEAIAMCIFEFNEEREMRLILRDERELGREEGMALGIEQGIEQSIILSAIYDLKHHVSDKDIILRICGTYSLNQDKVKNLLQEIKVKQNL